MRSQIGVVRMIKVHVFHTGTVVVDEGIPYKSRNPLAPTGLFRGKDKKVELPVSCYLIEHPQGRILIDTGWSSRYVYDRPHRFLGLLDSISTPVVAQGDSIDCKLEALGLTAKDIDCIFFSHMDLDHTSGLELLKDSKKIMASREEFQDANKYFYRYVKKNWEFADVQTFSFKNSGIGPVKKSYDIFGDGTVLMVNTPGHSHGHCSTLIRSSEKYIVLAGDAVYTQRSIKERIIPGFTVDKKLAKKSVEWIDECASDEHCIFIAGNHDPSVKEQTFVL